MAEARKWSTLSSICHDNDDDNGATFARELKQRLQERYPGVPVRDEWHGIGKDDFEVLGGAIKDSKFVVIVFNKDDALSGTNKSSTWFLDCWKQADRCLGKRNAGLRPIIIMIKPFCTKDLPPHISNVQTPVCFQANYLMDTERWKELLDAIKVENDIDANGHTLPIRQEDETLTDKWRKFIGKMYETLVEGLDPVNYIDGLLAKSVMTINQKDEIESQLTKRRQNKATLDIVVKLKEDNIKTFIGGLKRNERAMHNEMLQKMSEELKRDYDGLPPLPKPVSAPTAAMEVTEPTEPSQQRLPYSSPVSGGDGDTKEHTGEFSSEVSDAKAEAVPDTAPDVVPDTVPDSMLDTMDTVPDTTLDTVPGTVPEIVPVVMPVAVPEQGSSPPEHENQKICRNASCGQSMASNHKHCSECGIKYEVSSPAASAEKATSGLADNWMWLVAAIGAIALVSIVMASRKSTD